MLPRSSHAEPRSPVTRQRDETHRRQRRSRHATEQPAVRSVRPPCLSARSGSWGTQTLYLTNKFVYCVMRPIATAAAPVSVIRDAPKAGVLLKPLRREILGHARTPISASGIAAAMGRPRQVVNYHVRELAWDWLLSRAGRAKKRGLSETRSVVRARRCLYGARHTAH